MRNVLSGMVFMSLLTGQAQALINIRLTADSTSLSPGQTTTIRIWAQGTESGIFSLGGHIVASGPAVLTATPGTFAWNPAFSPNEIFEPEDGEPGANGGWSGFGSVQTQWSQPDSACAKADYVQVASYVVSAGTNSGEVLLTFAGARILGFMPLEVDGTITMGTLTPVSIRVIGPALEGDFDEDGQVSILDVLRLARAYGSSQGDPEFDAACDLDGDEIIGVGDLLILVGNFGKTS